MTTENKTKRKAEEAGRFFVEVLYEQLVVENNGTPEVKRSLQIATEVFRFENDKRSVALKNAENFVKETLAKGLFGSGGYILKTIITPGAIKAVGIIDMIEYDREQAEAEKARLEKEAEAAKPAEQETAPTSD